MMVCTTIRVLVHGTLPVTMATKELLRTCANGKHVLCTLQVLMEPEKTVRVTTPQG